MYIKKTCFLYTPPLRGLSVSKHSTRPFAVETLKSLYEVVAEMKLLMSKIKQTLLDLKQMDVEAASLSRLIYQLKLKFRQEKSLKVLQMINRCLTNYKTVHLPFIISSIEETLDIHCGPSRQMLEWAMIRIYGTANLFRRVYLLCIEAVGHLFVKIKLGQLWNMTLVPIAVCSRLWTFAQFIVRKACEWYNALYPYLDKLESSASPWLPEGCVLPRHLDITLQSTSHLQSTPLFQPTDIISELNVNTIDNQKYELLSTTSNGHLNDRVTDVGVRIPRCSFEEFGTKGREKDKTLENQQSSSKEYHTKLKGFSILPLCDTQKDCKGKSILNERSSIDLNYKTGVINRKQNTKQKTSIKSKCSLDSSQRSANNSYKHSLNAIESSNDLEQFLKYETQLQSTCHINDEASEKPLIRKTSKMQWLPVQKFIEEQIRLIKKAEKCGKSDKREKILQGVKLYIKKRMKS